MKLHIDIKGSVAHVKVRGRGTDMVFDVSGVDGKDAMDKALMRLYHIYVKGIKKG
jgi:hypothetical protein